MPVKLELEDADGTKFTRNFRVSFDFNVLARIEEHTKLKMLGMGVWGQLSASVVSVMFWAAIIPNEPDYDSELGLEVIRSYIGLDNVDVITEALWDAYLLNLPKAKAEELRKIRATIDAKSELPNVPAPLPAANSTGSQPGPSPDTTSTSPTTNSEAST